MSEKFRQRDIQPDKSLISALKQMDALDAKLLILVDNEKYVGLISAGDIQRAVINNTPLETPVINVIRKKNRVAKPEASFDSIRNMMMEYRMELCPVVNENNEILDIYFWEDIFKGINPKPKEQFNLPVVVMAGGVGSRLKPLTNVLPKALVPIGEKTMLEEIFERFVNYGCKDFYITLNYKAKLIEYYIRNLNLNHHIEFFNEEKPLGTAGSLYLMKGKINKTFFVSNCDIIIEQDYSEILNYHHENKNEITIVAALKNYFIPYGTIETGKNGKLLGLKEKPEITLKINSGMYILEPHLLDLIPENSFFHITQLINDIKIRNGKIGAFPVSEKSWKDIGDWDEYYKNLAVK
ncbi:MAG: nucleotidyltransferase family protein [Bacteroidales bacterium]|nr:nucleotidyltransferase family protein [Bacteroidales bacterium]